MGSTNVHSKTNKFICGGETIVTNKSKDIIKMPPQNSGKGPSIVEVRNNGIEIPVFENKVIKDKHKVARITNDGKYINGDIELVNKVQSEDKARD